MAERKQRSDALRAWMMLFVEYIADKQIIAPALNALVDDPHKLYEAHGQIWEAVRSLVKRAIKSGSLLENVNEGINVCSLLSLTLALTTPLLHGHAFREVARFVHIAT